METAKQKTEKEENRKEKTQPHPLKVLDADEDCTVHVSNQQGNFCLQIQQSSGGERKYKGPLNCAKQLYKEKGIRSLYRGTFATLLRGGYFKFSDCQPASQPSLEACMTFLRLREDWRRVGERFAGVLHQESVPDAFQTSRRLVRAVVLKLRAWSQGM